AIREGPAHPTARGPAERRGRRSSQGTRRRRCADAGRGRRPSAARAELDLVALDQGVREQLLAHPLDLSACLALVLGGEVELDERSDVRSVDAEAEVLQPSLDGLTLRVEDPALRTDEDRCFHPRTTPGSAR